MRPTVIAVFLALVVCCSMCANGYQIALQETDLTNDVRPVDILVREKRQMETFEDDDLNSQSQPDAEDTGFWNRVVSIAVRLFSRFVEWLNSS